jgi:hypothetical protein
MKSFTCPRILILYSISQTRDVQVVYFINIFFLQVITKILDGYFADLTSGVSLSRRSLDAEIKTCQLMLANFDVTFI